jgi:cold shock CspA family protein
MRGVVTKWIHSKGLGFIKGDLLRQDVIVHASDVTAGPIFEGARVEFTKKANTAPRGLAKANDVRVIRQ